MSPVTSSLVTPFKVTGCYNYAMAKKALIESNPYLRTPEKYRKALIANVSSSTAVETGTAVEAIARALTKGDKVKRVKTPQGSAR